MFSPGCRKHATPSGPVFPVVRPYHFAKIPIPAWKHRRGLWKNGFAMFPKQSSDVVAGIWVSKMKSTLSGKTPLCSSLRSILPRFPPFPASTRMIFPSPRFNRKTFTEEGTLPPPVKRRNSSSGIPGIIRTASLKEHPEQQSPQNLQTGMNDFPSQPRSRCRKSWRLRTTTILP